MPLHSGLPTSRESTAGDKVCLTDFLTPLFSFPLHNCSAQWTPLI